MIGHVGQAEVDQSVPGSKKGAENVRNAVPDGPSVGMGLRRTVGRRMGAWPHPGWSWTVTHDWLIRAAFAAATLLIGAALAGIPIVVAGPWRDAQIRDQALTFMVLGAAGLTALGTADVMRRGQDRLLRRNGTAYIIQEQAYGWSRDEARDFLIAARRRFARTIQVPGPGELAGPWDWPLDDGAQYWDQKVTDLTRSFQALHLDDNPQSPNGIFMWAWWAVTVAFAARVTAADRGLLLDVWQRPSIGRAGQLEAVPWEQGPHRFAAEDAPVAIAQLAPECAPEQFRWSANVTITSRVPAVHHPKAPTRRRPVSVLLLRLGRQSRGPLPAVADEPARPTDIRLQLKDAAGLGLPSRLRCQIHELRCLPPDGQPRFLWPVFPVLVSEAARWIRQATASMDGHTILLGTVMPPEVALGLGITAGRTDWPKTIWPILWQSDTGAFVVPRLDLGRTPLHPVARESASEPTESA